MSANVKTLQLLFTKSHVVGAVCVTNAVFKTEFWPKACKTNINDTISVKWIARTNKQPIFTSINNQSNIGLFNSKKGGRVVVDIIVIIFASLLSLFAFYSLSREALNK